MWALLTKGMLGRVLPKRSAVIRFSWWSVIHRATCAMWAALGSIPAVKLVNGYPALRANVEQPLALPAFAEQLVNQFVFEQAQFTVGDDQKISAAAGGGSKS